MTKSGDDHLDIWFLGVVEEQQILPGVLDVKSITLYRKKVESICLTNDGCHISILLKVQLLFSLWMISTGDTGTRQSTQSNRVRVTMMTLMPAVHSIISVNTVISVSINNSTKVFLLHFGYVKWCLRNPFSFSFHSSICLLLFWSLLSNKKQLCRILQQVVFWTVTPSLPPCSVPKWKMPTFQPELLFHKSLNTYKGASDWLFGLFYLYWTLNRGKGDRELKNTLSDSVTMVCWSRRLALSICWGHLSFALCASFG